MTRGRARRGLSGSGYRAPMGDVWLVRHGETEWSASGRHTSTDRPAADRRRARRPRGSWRRGWRATSFALVLTSPRERARRTAELAGFPAAEVDDDLVEWDYGDYEGITTDEIRRVGPGLDGVDPPQPRRRDRRPRSRRGWTAWWRAAGPLDGDVLLVGHGHALRALAARWLRLPVSDGRLLKLDTGTRLGARPRARAPRGDPLERLTGLPPRPRGAWRSPSAAPAARHRSRRPAPRGPAPTTA